MNATGRVKRPRSNSRPPNTSRTPPIQISVPNVAVWPFGGMPIGKAKSFEVPASMNVAAATMRSTLRSGPCHDDHHAAS
jgi:hypothetical protein